MSLSDNIIGGEEVRNGIECYRAQNASVIGNTINISFDEYETMGMSLYQLKNSTISGNSIKGAYLNIGIRESDDNTISNNYISDADYGLYFGNLYMFESLEISTAEIQYESITTTNATVYGNTIINSSISGIYLESTENSTFYDNYLNNINNTVFGEDNDNNAWNIEKTSIENIVGGPYQGGNYWIHPNGTGFSVDTDDVNNDGFCDQSYVITGNDTDVLPLAPAPAPEDKVSKEKDDKVSSFRRTPTSVGPSMPPENVESTDSLMKRIVSGSNIRYDFSNGGGPVMGISFESKEDKGKVVARIQVLKEKPEDVGDTSGNSYKMMSINVGKEDTISENNAEGILIEFKVSWEWINDNNIDPSTIRLSRYHDGEWVDLPGENIGDDGEFLYFNAYTPGFSIFSIVGDEAKESVTEEQVDEQSVTKKSVPDQTIAEEEPKEESAEESAQTPGFTSIFAVAFIAIVALYLRKKD
jgi:PGF-pre-PGF domain-containing protein